MTKVNDSPSVVVGGGRRGCDSPVVKVSNMVTPSNATALSVVSRLKQNSFNDIRVREATTPRKTLMMRKYQIASLQADGQVHRSEQIAPATPLFESAFSAFARGTLIETTNGPVSVEDLEPGTEVITAGKTTQQVLWVGSMTMVPKTDEATGERAGLARIMADSFGMARPMADFMAGPGARVLSQKASQQNDAQPKPILIPARSFIDGMNVIGITPQRPVELYHICLKDHSTITVAGLEVETFHPGQNFESQMGPNMLSLFMTLFPHIENPSDFGWLVHQRLPLIPSEGLELA